MDTHNAFHVAYKHFICNCASFLELMGKQLCSQNVLSEGTDVVNEGFQIHKKGIGWYLTASRIDRNQTS